MNLILLFADDFIAPDRVRLRGRRLQHVRTVHRAGVGDTLCVGRIEGQIGQGTVLVCDDALLEMQVAFTSAPPPPLPLTLLLALPRPKVLKRVLITATSMGVKQIYLLNSYRVEKSYWSSPQLSAENLHDTLCLGLEQARDTLMPQIHLRPLFKPFVEDELPSLCAGKTAVVAHPGDVRSANVPVLEPGLLAVGPEGGFIPYELDKLQATGFQAISLGVRILRVEAAVPALLACLFPPSGA